MKQTKLKTLLLTLLLCLAGVQTALADYDGNTFYFKGMKYECPGYGFQAAWQSYYNLYPWYKLNNSGWGGTYTHSYSTSIGSFFDMTYYGSSKGQAKNIMCSYHQYPMTIPAYSKLVRRATFRFAFYTDSHYDAAGLYMFDTESAATNTYVDMSYNQGQTKPAGHILSVWHTNCDSQWHEYYSGWVDITFDNSKGASKSDISKWFTFVQVSTNFAPGSDSGKESAQWTMNPTSISGYGYTDTWHYYKYVTFVANGGTGSISQLTIDNSGSLTTNTITRTGYTFAGWNTQADGSGTAYADGSAITATSDSKGPVTLYAQWQATPTVDSEGAVTFSDNVPVTPAVIDKAIADTKTATRTAFDLSNTTVTADNAKTIVEKIRGTEKSVNAFVFLPKVENLDATTKAQKNVITTDGTNSTCQNLELVDGTPMVTALVGKSFTATNASYTRTVSNNWGTICLPYAVKSDATIQYYKLRDTQGTEGTLYFEKMDEVPANTPAAFYQTNPGEIAPTATNAAISIQSNENNTGVSYYLVGTYKGLTLQNTQSDCFYIAQNQFWCADQSENGVTINPFRAYITTTNPNVSTAKASSLSISIWDGNEATAIGTIDANGNINVDGVYPELSRRAPAYNLAGQRVNNNAKGILIINGKKIIK